MIQTDEYVIPAYDAEAIQHTYWRGGCGPSAVANVYRGLYTHYNGVYLPVWGDAEFLASNRFFYMGNAIYFYKDMRDAYTPGIPNLVNREWVEMISAQIDNGLYASLCDFDFYYAYYKLPYLEDWGASLPCHLRRGLRRVTHGEYTLQLLNIEPHWHIRLYHLPVLLLSTEFNHYMVAYGTRYETWHWETLFHVLGKSWTVSSPKIILRKWFKINDNGYRTEPNGHGPYWMQDNVLNRFLFFGVRNF